MLKDLITRLLGRTEPVQPEPPQNHTLAISSEAAASAENPAAGRKWSPNPPPTVAESDCQPGVLSSYAAVNLDDNPLPIREVRQTGAVTRVPQLQGWCINPSTSFPLTVVGTDEKTARQIREALDGLVNHYIEDVSEAVAGLMVEHGARFHEFEDYLSNQRHVYHSALAAAPAGQGRKQSGADEDEEVENEALDALDNCCQDFEALIEGAYPSDPAEVEVIRSFGFGNLMRYLGTGPDTVRFVAPGHRKRAGFDALVRAGLAIAGTDVSDIPTQALLHAMTLKELQGLSSGHIPSKLRKKDLAVEFLLGQDTIRERAIAATSLDALYYLVPPPRKLAGFDLGGMRERMTFVCGAANLVVATYLTAALAPTNLEYEGKHLATERFKVQNVRDILTCRTCRKTHGQSKPLAQWSHFPLHFGCRCSLLIDGR
jgi:hypothetical protein